ncbi:hypothetical protein [Actinoplanes sp. NPDC049316]|uniref:hypothetical protein n=1 Tax=Actinoplanes sp. NPDC049316 TaxID=3154727 RepID=UPI00342EC840
MVSPVPVRGIAAGCREPIIGCRGLFLLLGETVLCFGDAEGGLSGPFDSGIHPPVLL